jgi:hypothetical protein
MTNATDANDDDNCKDTDNNPDDTSDMGVVLDCGCVALAVELLHEIWLRHLGCANNGKPRNPKVLSSCMHTATLKPRAELQDHWPLVGVPNRGVPDIGDPNIEDPNIGDPNIVVPNMLGPPIYWGPQYLGAQYIGAPNILGSPIYHGHCCGLHSLTLRPYQCQTRLETKGTTVSRPRAWL